MIELINLSKRFDSQLVINEVDLKIKTGETLAVIGPSGCGKSTLLKLILRLEEPTSGHITIDNKNINLLKGTELLAMRKKIGMIFQSSALFDSMDVFENVAFGLREHTKFSEEEIEKIVEEKLRFVDLEGKQSLMPSELSGGMQKRVSIARALAFDPEIILYDEPTTGLDPITSSTIEDLMNRLSAEGKVTSIVVTHQLSTIFRTAHRIIMLDNGKFIESGDAEQTRKSGDPVIKRFITAGLEEK